MAFSVQAQKTNKVQEIDNTPLLNGITVQADVGSALSSALSSGVTYSYEAGAQVDLKHKYFPIFEIGVAGANKTSNDNIAFKTNGMFSRLGIDINLLSPKKDQKPTTNLFLAGVRLGVSNFKYSLNNAIITDNYWGGTEILNYSNTPNTKIWYEIVVGVRVEVVKNIFMGWSIRSKNLLNPDVTGQITPWFIPGFGINNGSSWGFNYTIGYKLNIHSKIPIVKTIPKTELKKK
jgi:hypothetical protein